MGRGSSKLSGAGGGGNSVVNSISDLMLNDDFAMTNQLRAMPIGSSFEIDNSQNRIILTKSTNNEWQNRLIDSTGRVTVMPDETDTSASSFLYYSNLAGDKIKIRRIGM